MTVQEHIAKICDQIKDLLLKKNREYGNSALEPVRIFSKATPTEQILVRIDDKLSRIATVGIGGGAIKEDTVRDLIGYLVLLLIAIETNPIPERMEAMVFRRYVEEKLEAAQ